MPNRILKDSIRTSDTIDSLSWLQEVFFYRLIVSCDDYGRFDARPKIINSALFPLKDVTENQITDVLNKLSSVGMVKTYTVNSRPYLQITTWARHQQIRSKHAKYPGPDEADENSTSANQKQGNDINGYQMISDDIRCSRNPIQSNPNQNPNQESMLTGQKPAEPTLNDFFDEFWDEYPRKVGKPKAKSAYEHALSGYVG